MKQFKVLLESVNKVSTINPLTMHNKRHSQTLIDQSIQNTTSVSLLLLFSISFNNKKLTTIKHF